MIKEKLDEVISFYVLNDCDYKKTLETFGLSHDTLRRYINEYQKKTGNKRLSSISAIVNKYTNEELEILAGMNGKIQPAEKEYSFSGTVYRVGISSDWHIGSIYSDESLIEAMRKEFIKQGVQELWHAGDLTEGMPGRDGHIYECTLHGYKAQKNRAIDILKTFDIPKKMISGNHDLWYKEKGNMGADIVADVCDSVPNCEYLGEHWGRFIINGVKIDLVHGRDGANKIVSNRLQKIIEGYNGGNKPQILITGHDHKAFFLPSYRNVHGLEAGTMQWQTDFMRFKTKTEAWTGFWIVELCIDDSEVKYFWPRWYPFYK